MVFEHFILRRIDAREMGDIDSDPVLLGLNKMHAGYRVAVEWGVGGMKEKV